MKTRLHHILHLIIILLIQGVMLQARAETEPHPVTPVTPVTPASPSIPNDKPEPAIKPVAPIEWQEHHDPDIKPVPPIEPIKPNELPVPVTPTVQRNQLGVLLIQDQIAGNQFVTTLETSGMTLPGSVQPALFGALTSMGRNKYLAAWYPHNAATDIAAFTAVEPAELFAGLVNDRNDRIEGDIKTVHRPATDYVNPLLRSQFFDVLSSMSEGTQREFTLTEQLQNGGTRLVSTTVTRQAQIVLSRPDKVNCREETVAGVQGKACLVRHIQASGNLQSGDIRFILRARGEAFQAHYRVGQQWYPLSTPIPLADFQGS
ncbi:MAG: hypothetical protein ACRC5A_00890, partial [Enterobacteriaceae bacterium]